MRNVVIVCEDAGAAAALAIVASELASARRLRLVVATGAAVGPFALRGFTPATALGSALRQGSCVLLTGSTIWGARHEAQAVLAARQAGISTVTFIDFWTNYARRLSYPSTDRLEALPSRLAVIDEAMREDVLALGVDPGRVVVTGTPVFDRLWDVPRLEPDPSGPALFLSQPIEALFGQSLGYTEATVLQALAPRLAAVGRRLTVRPHPREDVERLRAVVAALPGQCAVVGGDLELSLTGAWAVLGMTTMGLVEAALRGLPVLSIQLGATAALEHPLNRIASFPVIVDEAQLPLGLAALGGPRNRSLDAGWAPGAGARLIALLETS